MAPGADEVGIDKDVPNLIENPARPMMSEENNKEGNYEEMSNRITSDNEECTLDVSNKSNSSPTSRVISSNTTNIEEEETTVSHSLKKSNLITSENEDEMDDIPCSFRKKTISSDEEEEGTSSNLDSTLKKTKVIMSDDEDVEKSPILSRKVVVSSDEEELSDSPTTRKSTMVPSDDDEEDLPEIHSISKKHFSKKGVSDDENDLPPTSSRISLQRHDISSDDEDELLDVHPVTKSSQPFPNMVLDPDVFGNNSESDDGSRRSVSSSRESHSDSEGRSNSKMTSKKESKKSQKKVPQRKASEQARAKTMQELASKTQKMVRDSRVSLPYHQPKQLTLDEFIKKRNRARAPLLSSLINSSSLGGMRKTISMEEDVLPIMAEVEADERKKNEASLSGVEGCKVWLDKLDTIEISCDSLDLERAETKPETNHANVNEDISENSNEKMEVNESIYEVDSIQVKEPVKDLDDQILAIEAEACSNESNSGIKIIENKIDESSKEESSMNCQTEIHEESISEVPSTASTSFKMQEAELNAFLIDKNPKPKRKTVAELLQNMPGFSRIANFQPKLGGKSNPKALINFRDPKAKLSKNEKGLQTLMDRFVRHACSSAADVPAEEHVKLHITKTEKDSQGILQSVLDEIDYVTPAPTEQEVDIIAKCTRPSGMSPQEQIPGQKMFRLKAALREQIWNKKAKEYKERLKLHAIYNEEKQLDDKISDDELPEDEEIMDEDSELSDSEEEEELEDISTGEKKKRKRILYVDDEAEDEDADEEDSEDEYDESETEDNGESKSLADSEDDLVEDFEDTLPPGQKANPIDETINELDSLNSPIKKDVDLHSKILGLNTTPIISAAKVLNQKSVSEFWSNKGECESSSVSPLNIPTSSEEELPHPIAELVSNTIQSSENLAELCSGKFPSQTPATPYETQTCFGFDLEDSEDDQKLSESCDKAISESQQQNASKALISTPTGNTKNSRSLTANSDTPKMSEKVVRSRSLGHRFEMEARKMREDEDSNSAPKTVEPFTKTKLNFGDLDKEENYEISSVAASMLKSGESDEEEEIGIKKTVKQRKKLTFSDDEDDEPEGAGIENEDDVLEGHEEEEEVVDYGDDEEGELERQLELQSQKKSAMALFGNDGRLRKKFFENEAELSGSEEGSGDEDERGINYYEKEDGDEEDIDEEALKSEVEKAHLKHLLDKDDRDIRRLQEEYLERGDLEDGKLRERKFRWNNLDEAFTHELARMGDSDGELEEDEQEVKNKLAEIERRKWIHEHSEIFEAAEEESQKMLVEKSKFLKLGKSTMRKIESFVENSSSFILNESSNSMPDVSINSLVKSSISFSAKMMFANSKSDKDDGDDSLKLCKATSQPYFASPDGPLVKMKKGSFLSRGGTTLSRIADITKGSDSTGTNIKSNSRNFVFSVLTPPEEAVIQKVPKRQANSQGAGQPKKMPRMDRSFRNLDDSSKDASIFKWM